MTSSPAPQANIQDLQMTTSLRRNDIFAESLHCSKASEIVGPAAKLAATVQVDSCRSFPLIRCYLAPPPDCRVACLPTPGPGVLCPG